MTQDVYRPPFDLWLKISYLVQFLEDLTKSDLKTIGSKEIQDELQIARTILNDPGVKDWLDSVKLLKQQNVLKQ